MRHRSAVKEDQRIRPWRNVISRAGHVNAQRTTIPIGIPVVCGEVQKERDRAARAGTVRPDVLPADPQLIGPWSLVTQIVPYRLLGPNKAFFDNQKTSKHTNKT